MSNYLKNVKQYFFHLPYLPSQVVLNVKSTLSQSEVFTLRRVSEWFVLLSNVRFISTTVNAKTYYNLSHYSGNTAHVYHCSPSKYNMCCHEGQSTAKSIWTHVAADKFPGNSKVTTGYHQDLHFDEIQ